jgi:hypothetical protein
MTPVVAIVTLSAQSATCAPPSEWGANNKTFGKWTVRRTCIADLGTDTLVAEAASEAAGRSQAFIFWCDRKQDIRALVVLSTIQLDRPMSLTLKGGGAPTVDLDEYVPTNGITQVALLDSADTKLFEAKLVDGPEPTFTLIVTSAGKSPVEMTFSRTGLAAAVRPLRSRCTW